MITETAPPSTDQAAPSTYDARSEQRKTITEAISSGVACRHRLAALLERLLAGHAAQLRELVRHPAVGHPQLRLDAARRDRVHPHALARVEVGIPARERQLGRLGRRVRQIGAGRPL